MKTFTLFIALIIAFKISAQDPDPDIFDQTWYLYEVHDSDTNETFYVENYDPPISPYVIIDQSYNFNGFGICNSFEGTLEYSSTNMAFRIASTSQTMNSCGFWGDWYEPLIIGPWGQFDPDPNWYSIVNPLVTDDPDGFQTFSFITQPFVYYTYRNTPVLGTEDFSEFNITLYPNPSDGFIQLHSENIIINSVVLRDLNGRMVVHQQPNSNELTIDIGSLKSGMYFLEIDTNNGTSARKIIRK